MSERDQSSLGDYGIDPNTIYGDFRDFIGGVRGRVDSLLGRFGLDTDWIAESPFAGGFTGDVYRYQYAYALSDSVMSLPDDGEGYSEKESPSPELQFKTYIYVLGEPTDALADRIKNVDNPRLRTLFNTGAYAGYITGFGFSEYGEYEERSVVGAAEVPEEGLGVPLWEVEAYDENGTLAGHANGRFNPFTTQTEVVETIIGSDIPQHEVWKFGGRQSHETGDRYQIAPPGKTPARRRAEAAAGKTVHINGLAIGSVLGDGRARLKTKHKSPARATYASRRSIIEQTGTPYQALSEGANAYKVAEDAENVYLSTVRPERDYDPIPPEDVPLDGLGVERHAEEVTRLLLDDDEPTQFTVLEDVQDTRLLGIYDPPVERLISHETPFGEIA